MLRGDYMKMHKNEYQELLEKLKYLKDKRIPELAIALKDAAELGDLRENSEFDCAQEEYSHLEKEIVLLETELKNAQIITKEKFYKVEVGATVVLNFEGEIETYTIKNSSALDETSISAASPLGMALLKHKKGDEININIAGANQHIKIIDIY